MTEVLTTFEDNLPPDIQIVAPTDEEVMAGFVTRHEAELLYMPSPLDLAACDRTARFYLGEFGIKAVASKYFTRLDLLVLASKYEAWCDEDPATRREHWLSPKPDKA